MFLTEFMNGLIDEIIERRYNLEEINEGFEALERGENGRGVLVFN